MEIDNDITTSPDPNGPVRTPRAVAYVAPTGDSSSFSKAVKAIEHRRAQVRGAAATALLVRLVLEYGLIGLLADSDRLLAQVPIIGLALLSYLVVLMWMAKGSGDRLGFGMAIGLGVIEPSYLVITAAMQSPFDIREAWAPIAVAVAHVPMAVFELQSAKVYPAQDTKAPWIFGFVVALAFLSVPWVAPSLIDAMGW